MATKKKAPKKAARKPKEAAVQKPGSAASSLAHTLQKKFTSGVFIVGAERKSAAAMTEFISTGVDVLDHYVIGRGGWPVGRMSETYSEEGAGKTALLLHSLASAQRAGGIAVLADSEGSFDEERATAFGVNLDELILLGPANLEELFEMAKATLRAHRPHHGPMLFGWDSIASTRTKHGLVQEAGDKKVADVALLMSEELPKVRQLLAPHRAHFMMLNQIRHKIGVSFGSNVITPGGNAPKFYSDVRLQFFGGKAVKRNDQHVAKIVTIMAVKNRLRAPFAKARVRFDYATGYNNVYSTCEHAKRLGLIKPRKGTYNGAGRGGLAVYAEAVHKLGWPVNVESKETASSFVFTEEESIDDGNRL
jgi:recombination protein RecA